MFIVMIPWKNETGLLDGGRAHATIYLSQQESSNGAYAEAVGIQERMHQNQAAAGSIMIYGGDAEPIPTIETVLHDWPERELDPVHEAVARSLRGARRVPLARPVRPTIAQVASTDWITGPVPTDWWLPQPTHIAGGDPAIVDQAPEGSEGEED